MDSDTRRTIDEHYAILSNLENGICMGHTPRHRRTATQKAATAHRKAIEALRTGAKGAKARSLSAHALTKKAIA